MSKGFFFIIEVMFSTNERVYFLNVALIFIMDCTRGVQVESIAMHCTPTEVRIGWLILRHRVEVPNNRTVVEPLYRVSYKHF